MSPLSPDAARDEQESLAGLAVPLAVTALDVLDPGDLPGTVPSLLDTIEALVTYYGQAASGAMSEWFKAIRSEKVSGRITVPPAPLTQPGFIDSAVVDGATAHLMGTTDLMGPRVEQLVLDQGRRQLLSAVATDREATGWARVPNPGACSFCLMLATRPLYKSKRSASFLAHTVQPNGSGGDCRCGAEPIFGQWEPSARVREAQALWAESTKGRTGHDARVAFRQAVEGRPVTGAPGKGVKRAKGQSQQFDPKGGTSPEAQRFQLELLQSLPPAKTPQAAAWRVKRVAEIRKFLGE